MYTLNALEIDFLKIPQITISYKFQLINCLEYVNEKILKACVL